MKIFRAILTATIIPSTLAFAPNKSNSRLTPMALKASPNESFDPLHLTEPKTTHAGTKTLAAFAASTAASLALSPLAAIAEEADDYEYGAVDAPIGLAWGAGILVIATALLPLAMQGGEEAFEEMRQKDAGTWGTGNSDRLNKRK